MRIDYSGNMRSGDSFSMTQKTLVFSDAPLVTGSLVFKVALELGLNLIPDLVVTYEVYDRIFPETILCDKKFNIYII